MVLTVYLDPCTVNSRKVLAGLELLGTKYELKHVDYFKGEHKSEEYKKLNPCATVPTATDGDLVITESNAILQYAADLRANEVGMSADGDQYYPKNLKKRADVNRWLLWESSKWFQSCYIYLVENVVKPLLKSEPDQAALDAESENFHNLASVADQRLGQSRFLNGEGITIADIAVAAPMHLWRHQKLPLDKHPNLKRWIQEVESMDCWKKTQKAVDDALLPGSGTSNGTNGTNGSTENTVRASINYTKDVTPKLTELYFYESPEAANIHQPGDEPHEVTFTDGWYRFKEFSHDKEGFSVHDLRTRFEEWENEELVRKEFYPEVVEWLKKTVGAKRVLVFDHTIRTHKNQQKKLTQETNTSQRAPVMLVHCDYTAESGPLRVKQLLGEEAELLQGRVAFFNVWKPVHNVVEERPLAMCDITSTSPSDFFKLHLRYRDRNGENYVMRHSEKHKWWYFPHMTPEQVILLKCFDSDEGRARFVGHTAFEDPTTKKGAKVRESVEIRTIAFF